MKRQSVEWKTFFANHVCDNLVSRIKNSCSSMIKRQFNYKWTKNFNRQLSKEGTRKAKHRKRCPMLLAPEQRMSVR